MTGIQQKSQRRQRRLFAAIAGWALLGAASTGHRRVHQRGGTGSHLVGPVGRNIEQRTVEHRPHEHLEQ